MKRLVCWLWISLFMTAGCAGLRPMPDSYFHPQADLAGIRKIAVLRFENMSNDRFAGEKLTHIMGSEILLSRVFDLVEPGQVEKVLYEIEPERRRLPEPTKAMDLETIKKLGGKLGIEALMLGSVEQYEMARSSNDSYPQIALTVRLIDVETGSIIWSCSHSLKGGPRFPVISAGEIFTLPRLSQKVCRQIVGSLINSAR